MMPVSLTAICYCIAMVISACAAGDGFWVLWRHGRRGSSGGFCISPLRLTLLAFCQLLLL